MHGPVNCSELVPPPVALVHARHAARRPFPPTHPPTHPADRAHAERPAACETDRPLVLAALLLAQAYGRQSLSQTSMARVCVCVAPQDQLEVNRKKWGDTSKT